MVEIKIPGVDSIDDIIRAFKDKGTWLNRFESITSAIDTFNELPDGDLKNEILNLLKTALRLHLQKEKLADSKAEDSQGAPNATSSE